MEPLYLLIAAGAFALTRKKTAASPAAPTGGGGGAPPPPVPASQRVAIIKSLWQNQIPGLDYVRYALFIGQRESGSNYRPKHSGAIKKGYPLGMNDHGYAGMYQMGAAALETHKYIKAGTCARKGTGGNHQILTTLENWTDRCPGGIEQFMNTPEIQERAMLEMTIGNYRGLKRNGVVTDASAPKVKAGYLSAAHLKGVGGAIALSKGNATSDAYGTSTDVYYAGGSSSQLV